MLSLAKLQERRGELLANVEALNKLAESEDGRDFTPDELKQVDQWMGEIESLDQTKIPQAKKFDELRRQSLQTRAQEHVNKVLASGQIPANYDPGTAFSDLQPNQPQQLTGLPQLPQQFQQPVPQNGTPWNAVRMYSGQKLRSLDNEDQALCLGMFLRAAAWGNKGDHEAMRFCEHRGIVMKPDKETGFMTMDARSKLLDVPGLGLQSMQNIVGDVAGTPEKGGYLVPTLLASMILKVVDKWIIARRVSRVVTMAGENVDYPKHANVDLTISKPNAGTFSASSQERADEIADITQSNVTYDQVNLRAADGMTLTAISNRLLRENVISAADQVVTDAARAIAKQMDYEMLVATGGSGSPNWGNTGLVTGLNADASARVEGPVGTAADWSGFDDTHFSALMGKLADRFYETPGDEPQCCFICSRAFYHSVFERLQIDKAWGKRDVAGQSYFTYSGYPIYFSEHMPKSPAASTVSCLFGNFYETTLTGIRQDVSVAMSDAPFFAKDQMAVRVKASWHCLNHRDGLNGDGYVGLVTAAT